MNSNLPVHIDKKVSMSQYLSAEGTRKIIEETVGKRSQQFITSVISVTNSSTNLKACDKRTILSACLTAAAIDLPINNNLGFAYVIPYGGKAQFQMGYKGFVQLALRSGMFSKLNVSDVRQGELKSIDRLTGELDVEWVSEGREKLPVVGYVAYMQLTSGFSKSYYKSSEEINAHGKKFSKSYRKGYGLWVDDFDAMAKKTVLKLLLSKYAPMSTAMQTAIQSDQAVIMPENGIDYPDNTPDDIELEATGIDNTPVASSKVNDFVKKKNQARTPDKKTAEEAEVESNFDRDWARRSYFAVVKEAGMTHEQVKQQANIASLKELTDDQLVKLIEFVKSEVAKK